METKENDDFCDLADFCEKWQNVRKLMSNENLMHLIKDAQAREIIFWLIRLADKICTYSTLKVGNI